jgi:hypothetical protein
VADEEKGIVYVYVDGPLGVELVSAGCDEILSLVFQVKVGAVLGTYPLDVAVLYATGLDGVEVPIGTEGGTLEIDTCQHVLDMNEDGVPMYFDDGVLLYRALKYGFLNGLIPIRPDWMMSCMSGCTCSPNVYLLSDKKLIALAKWLVETFDLDVDGDGQVIAARDAVYIYRFLLYLNDANRVNLILPAGHTGNAAAIDAAIAALNQYLCPDNATPLAACLEIVDQTTICVWFNEEMHGKDDGALADDGDVDPANGFVVTIANDQAGGGASATPTVQSVEIASDSNRRKVTITVASGDIATGDTITVTVNGGATLEDMAGNDAGELTVTGEVP